MQSGIPPKGTNHLKPYHRTIERIAVFVAFCLAIIWLYDDAPAQESHEEETYAISLVQTANADKELHEVEGVKVLAESYTVEKGDTLWTIYRKKGLTDNREKLRQLLYALKRLNKSSTIMFAFSTMRGYN